MNFDIKHTAVVTLALLVCAISDATPRYYGLSGSEGLSNSSVMCMTQDSRGLLWIGTWDGLNVYDSHSFVTYRNDPADNNTISNNIISGIAEQKPGIIWVSTNYGINRINTEDGTIKRFYPGYEHKAPLVEKTFSVAVINGQDVFCSAKGWGLAFYDEENGQMVPFNIPDFSSIDIDNIYGAGNGRVFLLSTDGSLKIMRYAFPEKGKIDIISIEEVIPGVQVSSVFDSRGRLYIISNDNIIHRYDCSLAALDFTARIRQDIHITAMAEFGQNTLAIASYPSGVYLYNTETGHMAMEDRLSDVSLHVLYSGTQDILWAGSDGQGLRALYDDTFNMEKVPNSEISSTQNYPVRAFFKDREGNLFVGTKGNGVAVFKDGKRIRTYTTSEGLGNNSVYAFTEGLCNDILLGHDGKGLNSISLLTGKVTSIIPEEGPGFGSVYSFYKDPDDNSLWIGTYRDGLIRIKLEWDGAKYKICEYESFKNDKYDATSINSNNVFPILGCKDIIWVGTRGGGLCRYDKHSGKFTAYTTGNGSEPISSNEILSLYISRDSTLWIGTGHGLNKLIPHENGRYSFMSYTVKDGLPNNTIMGIVEDWKGNLWMSTNKGLSVFNPETEQFINYYNNEALQDNEYADGAYYKDCDGFFYFGGRDGFNKFDPRQINARPFQSKVLIRGFNVQQRPLSGFNPEKETVLKHNENFFSIHYTALEYINNPGCEYFYKMQGFDEDWIYAGTGHTASYTNVPPGRYTFMIRSTNGDKIWSERITSMEIQILPPWWNTVWAHILYALAGILAIYSAYRWSSDRIKRKHRFELEELKRKQLQETYEAKLRFFTNIAHEFTTPLTLICGPLEQIGDKYHLPSKVEQYLRVIRNNAGRLLQLIEELIEFRRVDTGHQKPEYSTVCLPDTITSILDNFSELKDEKQIELCTCLQGPAHITTDQNAIEKILYNLISNAYKYTPVGGSIHIETSENPGGETVLAIKNSGKGIRPENLERVFDRFVILDTYEHQASQGNIVRNGIGMALVYSLVKMLSGDIKVSSDPGKFTVFTLTLPKIDESLASNGMVQQHRYQPNTYSIDYSDITPHQESGKDKPLVMVVDDDPEIRNLVSDILNPEYRTVQAVDGQNALDRIKRGLPDLIITDLNMPVMNGAELLKHLKSNEITRVIPVIFLAFKTDIGDEIETYEMGCEAFIPKPFYPKHLTAIVHQVLHNRAMLKNYYNSSISSNDIYEGEIVDSDDKKFLIQLSETIEQNITDENLSPAWLSEKMLMSRMQFYRKLKELTQQTPSEFIRNVKLNKAVHLLKTTNLTILEVMYNSGFNNKSYFYREFTAKYSMSPKEFRKENRQ